MICPSIYEASLLAKNLTMLPISKGSAALNSGVLDKISLIVSLSNATFFNMSVITLPGATALTLIPYGARDIAIFLVKLLIPPLLALYPEREGMAVMAFTELMLMIEHMEGSSCLIICFAAAWHVKKHPFKLTRRTSSKSSSEVSKKGAERTMPALATAMWREPYLSTAVATAKSTEDLSPTSHTTEVAVMSSCVRASCAFDRAVGSISASTRDTPALPRDWQIANPIPLAAPVTRATMPCRLDI